MTDDEVVKVLAEFMGLVGDIRTNSRGDAWFLYGSEQDDGYRDSTLLEFLTSYDAIAEVWRKMRDSMPDTHDPFVNPACMYCVACEAMKDACWFGSKPREHAYALAKAIREASDAAS